MNLGVSELVIVLTVLTVGLGPLALVIWAVADAANRAPAAWEHIGESRTTWIVILVVGLFVCALPGALLAIWYLVVTRPKLAAAGDAPG